MNHMVYSGRCHYMINHISESCNPHIQQILKKCSNHTEGQEKHKSHNTYETRNSCIFTGKHFINFLTAKMFFAFFWLYNRLITDILNKIKTHVSNSCCSVQTTFCLHLFDDMFQHFFLILIKVQTVHDKLVAFRKLCCCKTNRNLCRFCMVFNQMHDRMKTSVHRTTIFIGITEINVLRLLLIFGNV